MATQEAGTIGTKSKIPERFHDYHPMPVGSTVTARQALHTGGSFDIHGNYQPIRTFASSQDRLEVVDHRGGEGTGQPSEVKVRNSRGEETWIPRFQLRGKTTGRGHKLPAPTGLEEPYHRESAGGTCQQGQRADLTGCTPAQKSLAEDLLSDAADRLQAMINPSKTDALGEPGGEKEIGPNPVYELHYHKRLAMDRLAKHLGTIAAEGDTKALLERVVKMLHAFVKCRECGLHEEDLDAAETKDLLQAVKDLRGFGKQTGDPKNQEDREHQESAPIQLKSLDAMIADSKRQEVEIDKLQKTLAYVSKVL
jgi:hypothetical protein